MFSIAKRYTRMLVSKWLEYVAQEHLSLFTNINGVDSHDNQCMCHVDIVQYCTHSSELLVISE